MKPCSTWWLALGGFAALLAHEVAPAQQRGPLNHYILECADGCPQKALEAPIGVPTGVATDGDGNVYFTSQHLVFKLLRDGTLVRFAGTGVAGFSGDGGSALGARLNLPLAYAEMDRDPIDFYPFASGIAVDAIGNVYIADTYNGQIRRVDVNGTIDSVRDDAGNAFGRGWPQGIAVDAAGRLYMSEQYGAISRRDPDGRVVVLVSWNCGPGYLGDGACVPEQIAVDGAGAVYFGDTYCRVRKWVAGVGTTTVAGYGDRRLDRDAMSYCGNSGDGGPATLAELSLLPYAVAFDADDRLYIADTYNHCVRRVDRAGTIVPIAGVCSPYHFGALLGDEAAATQARLREPLGIAVDREGNLYIADSQHLRIRKVTPGGIITTVAGNGEPLPAMQVDSAVKAP